jgi:hypothetical protein
VVKVDPDDKEGKLFKVGQLALGQVLCSVSWVWARFKRSRATRAFEHRSDGFYVPSVSQILYEDSDREWISYAE